MSISRVQVAPTTFESLRFLGAKPKMTYGEETQQIDPNTGKPIWTVSVLAKPVGVDEADKMKVSLIADKCPQVEEFAKIVFPDLIAGCYVSSNNAQLYFRASQIARGKE